VGQQRATPLQPTGDTGWFPDPWAPGWRWRSRGSWTPYRVYREAIPQLPPWLSIPILIILPFSVWEKGSLIIWAPGAALLIIPPMAIVLIVFRWIDTIAPEPRQGRLHALLWGFVIAGFVSGFVNSATEEAFGTFAALVVSAPLIEELTKGSLLLWAVRRAEIDGPVDGAVYAAWSAAGFAASENLYYFTDAAWEGGLVEEFIGRGLYMPLAHPMFTIVIGLAVGRAVRYGTNVGVAFGLSLIPAAAAHSLWNYGVVLGEEGAFDQAGAISLLFVLIFVGWGIALAAIRRSHAASFAAGAERLKLAVGLFPSASLRPEDLDGLAQPEGRRARRRMLSGASRRRFDDGIVLFARALLRSRADDAVAPVEFQVLLDHLSGGSIPSAPVGGVIYPPPSARPGPSVAAEQSSWWQPRSTDPPQDPSSGPTPWWD
jgi:protease PrsW